MVKGSSSWGEESRGRVAGSEAERGLEASATGSPELSGDSAVDATGGMSEAEEEEEEEADGLDGLVF